MLSLLTAKSLLWATGILTLLLAASTALNVRQFKQIGAAEAKCEATISKGVADRSQATTDLVTQSLKNQVTALREQITHEKQLSKAAHQRQSESSKLLSQYIKELDEARKANPSLDEPVDTSRLRRLEDAYRVRASASRDGSISRDP